jgi:hypothetical protein
MPLQFITLRHDKGPSQRKTVRAEIYFYKGHKCQMASIAIKEAVMQKRVFPVGSFFDTFLAVQKSMPNVYDITI